MRTNTGQQSDRKQTTELSKRNTWSIRIFVYMYNLEDTEHQRLLMKTCVAFDLLYSHCHSMKIMTHLFGLVATPHVLSDVLDAVDGLFDLR